MRRYLLLICVLAVLLGGVTQSLAQVQDGYRLDWWSIGGSAGSGAASGFSLSGSIGQPAPGEMSGAGYSLNGGFLSLDFEQAPQFFRVHLPLITR